MTSLRHGFWIVLAITTALAPGFAFHPPEDGVLFRESFNLSDQETYSGNLIAVDSILTLEAGSTFEGNIILLGGSLESAGKVVGDVASIGASIHIAPESVLSGNVVCIGAAPRVDSGAKITGSINTVEGFSIPFSPATEDTPEKDEGRPDVGYEFTVVLFRVFLMAAVATLIILFLPSPADRVSRTIVEKPALSFLIGLLTMIATIALFLLLALTVCLSPISLLGSVILLVAILLGWTALGSHVGRQVCGMVRRKAHPAVMAGIGTAILTLVASAVGYVPFAGPFLILFVSSFGLGAVVLTRFGGPDYQILPKGNPPVSS